MAAAAAALVVVAVAATDIIPLADAAAAASASSSSSPPYNAYNYDLTTPQFTPDGRLLQVEYAARATGRSGPLVAVPVALEPEDPEEGSGVAVVMAALVPSSSPSGTAAASPTDDRDDRAGGGPPRERTDAAARSAVAAAAASNARRRRRGRGQRRARAQSRLVVLPLSPFPSSSAAPASASASVVLGLSGVLSDATSLLAVARDDLTSYRRMYGLNGLHRVASSTASTASSAPPSKPTVVARRLSRAVGDQCQQRSFGGGLRPYGASVLVCGVDETGACLCVTEPGGGVRHRRLTLTAAAVIGRGTAEANAAAEAAADSVVVVGGEASVQSRIRRLVASNLRSVVLGEGGEEDGESDSIEPPPSSSSSTISALRRTVDAAVEALMEVHGMFLENACNNAESGGDPNHHDYDDDDGTPPPPLLEVVIASPGITTRLTDEQVGRIVDGVRQKRRIGGERQASDSYLKWG